jgi:hypothetical protein
LRRTPHALQLAALDVDAPALKEIAQVVRIGGELFYS